MTARTCYFCERPISDDEKAIQAKTKNAWAHFECWYDGEPFDRDPITGEVSIKNAQFAEIRVRLRRG